MPAVRNQVSVVNTNNAMAKATGSNVPATVKCFPFARRPAVSRDASRLVACESPPAQDALAERSFNSQACGGDAVFIVLTRPKKCF